MTLFIALFCFDNDYKRYTLDISTSLSKCFPRTTGTYAYLGWENIERNQWQSLWLEQAPNALLQDGLAYFHIPFCASHCIFVVFIAMLGRKIIARFILIV